MKSENGYDYSAIRDQVLELEDEYDKEYDIAFCDIEIISIYMECVKKESEFPFMTDNDIKQLVKKYVQNDIENLKGLLPFDYDKEHAKQEANFRLGRAIFGWAHEYGYRLKGSNLKVEDLFNQFELAD